MTSERKIIREILGGYVITGDACPEGQCIDMADCEELRKAVEDLLRHRVGTLPTEGYLRDTDASRAALARLAELVGKT